MGKYEKFVKLMERRVPEDGRYQSRVEERKREIKERGPEDLARRYRRLRGIIERAQEREKKLNLDLTATMQLMNDAFAKKGITKITFAEGGAVSTQDEVYVSIHAPGLAEKLMTGGLTEEEATAIDPLLVEYLVKGGVEEKSAKEMARASAYRRLRAWAEANGHSEDLTINSQTLSSIFKEMLLEGLPIPEFVKFQAGTSAKLFS